MSQPLDAANEPARSNATSRSANRRRQGRRSTQMVVVAAIALFGALAAWIATREPPYVTHRDALAMAAAVENAKSLEQLRRLIDFPTPTSAPAAPMFTLPSGAPAVAADLADLILSHKQRGAYTFLGIRGERTDNQRLLFRSNTESSVLDYHELRVDHRGGVVKVVDLRSLVFDAWLSRSVQERERLQPLAASAPAQAFVAAVAGTDAEAMLAAFRTLPDELRASSVVCVQFLAALDGKDYAIQHAVFVELRSLHPDNLAADFHVLGLAEVRRLAPDFAPQLRADALAAIYRIHTRVEDDTWLKPLRDALQQ